MKQTIALFVSVTLAFALGCGGPVASGAPAVVAPIVASTVPLSIEPSTAAVRINATVKFSANESVTWSVREGRDGGTIGSDGLYAAPNTPGVYHVVATAVADSGRSATAIVSAFDSGSSSAVAALAAARFSHLATLLADGNVLVTGGLAGSDYDHAELAAPAELFSASSLNFSSTGRVARFSHTATLLRTGEVLVLGGATLADPAIVASAELYDPVTQQFQAASNMTGERDEHTATRLIDGRVLVAGGYNSQLFDRDENHLALRTAEIYDPATRTFAPTGNMKQARAGHTATLLRDGRVLMTGGFEGGVALPLISAELYDPVTGAFTLTGSMVVQREYYAATLLANGNVLITGGNHDSDTRAEIYDPSTGLFTLAAAMTTRRFSHTATLLLSGTVLVAGGATGFPLASVELYDPISGQFKRLADLQTGRSLHTATLLSDGSVLIVGGNRGDGTHFIPLSSAEIYKLN
jgi:hypothetical protein